MRGFKTGNKRLIPLILCSVLVLQQTGISAALASMITDGNGVTINPIAETNRFEIRPDLFNDKVGFKEFQNLQLSEGDILNFIFQAYNIDGTGNNTVINRHNVDTFVNFVNNQIKIDGIVNAVTKFNSTLKNDGNLVFISPEGMVVGSSGVLNVGSLGVFTPTQSGYNTLKSGMKTVGLIDGFAQAEETTKTWNPNDTALFAGNAPIIVNGGIVARGDVELNGSLVEVGSTGRVFAGVSDDTVINGGGIPADSAVAIATANELFRNLVNADNMNVANTYSNANGEIKITSSQGTSVADGGMIRNFASESNTTITNNGVSGVTINGEVSNANGSLTITNNAGEVNAGTSGELKNKGTMTIIGQNSNQGITINGAATNDGDMVIKNSVGTKGLNIGGNVTNNTGTAEILNVQGGLNVTNGGKVTSNGTSLLMENSGSNGLVVDGQVNNNSGTLTIKNTNNKLTVSETGRVNSRGSKIEVTNTGNKGMNIQGAVSHRNPDGTVTFTNSNSDIIIGHTTTDFNITSDADINITAESGNIYNYGVVKTLIQAIDGADLNITAKNGAIGKEVGPCADGVCTGIGGADARDLTKSINTEIDGIITANSKGSNALVNMASLSKDMHINQINSDGRVILLADHKTTKGKFAYDILNNAIDATKPNITGTGISVIASGDIGKKSNKITFIQKNAEFNNASWNADKFNYTPKSGVKGVDMLAIKDINVKGLDNADGTKNDTNVCAIISRTGDVDAEFSGNTYIKDVTAEKNINLVNRGQNMYIENLGKSPTYYPTIGDYYGNKTDVVPESGITIAVLDLGTVANPNTAADSTLVVKNGVVNGNGLGRPSKAQDIIVTADNAYLDGYYFNMGKNRMPGHSTVTVHSGTNTITSPNGKTVSVRGKAVRPYDVTDIGRDKVERNYYYGSDEGMEEPNGTGSEQGWLDTYDGTKTPDGKDDDNLVIPVPDKPEPPTPPGPDPDEPYVPVDPIDPINPINPVEPVDPDDPINPIDPVTPITPIDPISPVDPTGPDRPIEPVDPVNIDRPINPVDPVAPTPVNPVNPVNPTDPSGTITVVDPINPYDPNPSTPANPQRPVDPTDPSNPNNPVNPMDPLNPERPNGPGSIKPVNPNPVDPTKPIDKADTEDPEDKNPTDTKNPERPVDPTDPTNPNNPVRPIDPTDPMNPNGPDGITPVNPNPVDPTKPIDKADTEYPFDPNPSDPLNPVNPVDPTDPTNPNNPVKPIDPTDPTNPNGPIPVDPISPVNPTDPTGPIDSANTEDPFDPNPSDPLNPVKPVDPKDPTDPYNPVSPLDPEHPDNANRPNIVDDTIDPLNPINPNKPNVPNGPYNPFNPVGPGTPDNPNPDVPNPDNPNPDVPNPDDPNPDNPNRPDIPNPFDPERPDIPVKPADPDPVDPVNPNIPSNPDEPIIPGNPLDPIQTEDPNKPLYPDDPERPLPTPVDPSSMYKQRIMEHGLSAIDKRQQIRVNVSDSATPIQVDANSPITKVVDISRGGMSVTHNNTLKVGDIVPVHITYGDVQIDANIKVVSATKERAGTQFVDLDPAVANQLLFLGLTMDGQTENQVIYSVREAK